MKPMVSRKRQLFKKMIIVNQLVPFDWLFNVNMKVIRSFVYVFSITYGSLQHRARMQFSAAISLFVAKSQ
jgi:hypothetical protein